MFFLHVLIFKLLLRCRQFRLGVLFATEPEDTRIQLLILYSFIARM